MISLKFSYRKWPSQSSDAFPDKKLIKRPTIPIKVKYGNKGFDYIALIDSGADFCIFHNELGEALEIDIRKGKRLEFFGITGIKEEAFFHDIVIEIGGHDKKLFCGFSYQLENVPYGILGQKGFFDLFEIKMNYQKNRIELKEKS